MWFAGAMIQAIPVEIGQLGVAAMDVADGVGEHAGNSVPVPRIFNRQLSLSSGRKFGACEIGMGDSGLATKGRARRLSTLANACDRR